MSRVWDILGLNGPIRRFIFFITWVESSEVIAKALVLAIDFNAGVLLSELNEVQNPIGSSLQAAFFTILQGRWAAFRAHFLVVRGQSAGHFASSIGGKRPQTPPNCARTLAPALPNSREGYF